MFFVKRKVRSSGRTSGSIEITLPPEMHALEGIECRLILCDGARPEIVIQPDVSLAEIIFADLWEQLQVAFTQIGDIGDFALSDFNVSFLPPRHWHDRPPLSYRDGLAIYRAQQGQFQMDNSGLSHVITFLTVGAAYRLGLQDRYALVFGIIVGYLVSGMSAGHGADFEQDVALQLFNGDLPSAASHSGKAADTVVIPLGALFTDQHWERAQQGFKRIFDQVQRWQNDSSAYEAVRRQWWTSLDRAAESR
ncbi:MAG: hypothetical protein ACOYNY_07600 [Caldilineaceae bacterium]|jgi:hypothetical protein